MAHKLLQSIKFPNLVDTYHTPPLVEEYDPEYGYVWGDYCFYNGSIFRCRYIPDTENDPKYLEGDFNPIYWEEIDYSVLDDLFHFSGVASLCPVYEPSGRYFPGDVVLYNNRLYNNRLYVCIQQTTTPAGTFNEDYWEGIEGTDFNSQLINYILKRYNFSYMMRDLVTKYSDEIPSPLNFKDWNKEDLDPETENFYTASILISDIDNHYDYLITVPAIADIRVEVETFYDGGAMIDHPFNSTFDGRDIYIIPSKIFDSTLNNIKITIHSNEKVWDSEQGWLDEFVPLTDNILERISNQGYFALVPSVSDSNSNETYKLVLQDYTEVYKSLADTIFSLNYVKNTTESDTTSTLDIPLNEGNIALQFINFPTNSTPSWSDIDVELELFNDYTSKVIKLSKIDKNIFIVNKNMQTSNSIEEWLGFRLLLSYQGSELDAEQKRFVDSSLNILRKPKTQSNPNPIRKNNEEAVNEFINVALSYVKAYNIYNIGCGTFLQDEYNTISSDESFQYTIDAATFIGLCLRGLDFDCTPYSANFHFPFYKEEEGEE